ncbi:hypothetical protein EYZ11_006747 [Aspergillus tanneri]|uniref:Aldehyde dehydrogenase domain-containing protein n=1 Tax=Aspergillus tanneri TaxID=1220188 RepID=A0A4S3JF11_9EURO|nr:hypothetical protein EYZ11_006747 [Aspergillus tanneri]
MHQLPFQLNNPDLLHFDSFVGNAWVTAQSGERFDVVDPGTDLPWASCPTNSATDVDAAVRNAHAAFQDFRHVSARQRAQWLLAWDALIRAARDDLAQIITHETGKPLAEARGEIDYATSFTWWFAGEAERIHGNVSVAAVPDRRVFTLKQPIGVAAALVPWNFPVAMVLRKASAALAAGCTMVVKPSPESPVSALVLAELARQAGFPAGVLNVLTTDLVQTPALSEALCRHPLVRKVSFTGSTHVGKLIARHCADGLKKLTLELGGCITANRVYVQAGVYERFAELLTERTRALVVGHGAQATTTMGPLTTRRGLDKAQGQVDDARQRGAQVRLGGHRLEGKQGYFFAPTILMDMTAEMRVSQEESFAPLAALYRFETEAEAVRLANNTSMGLASYVFTQDVDRIWRLFEQLEAGMVGLNTGNSSAAESPFGGIKDSGYGKESGRGVAVDEYLVTKTGTLTVGL